MFIDFETEARSGSDLGPIWDPPGYPISMFFLRKCDDFDVFALFSLRPLWSPFGKPLGGLLGALFGRNLVLRSAKMRRAPSWTTLFRPRGPLKLLFFGFGALSGPPERQSETPPGAHLGPERAPRAPEEPKIAPECHFGMIFAFS